MINPFIKENRIYSTLSNEQKQKSIFYKFVIAIIFIINSFVMYEFVFDIANIIGSIICGSYFQAFSVLFRMLPIILLNIALIHLNISIRHSYKNNINSLRNNSVITIIFGFIIIIYVLFGILFGKYHSLVEGYPSILFPLDILLTGIALIIFGVFINKYYQNNRTTNINKTKINISLLIFKIVLYMISLSSFAMLCYYPFVVDFTNGGIFYNTMLFFVIACQVIELLFEIIVMDEIKDECKKIISFKSYLIMLIINIIIFIIYIISVTITPWAPNLNSFGLLPIDYLASFNIFLIVYFIGIIIGPLIKLIASIKKTE